MATDILVLRLSSLGDVVLTSTFLESLHERFPDARVTFVVRADLAPVAGALPHVGRVLAVERRTGPVGLLRLASRLAAEPWTHVFDLHGSLRSHLLTSGLWRLRRAGFHKQELPRAALVRWKRDLYPRFGGAVPLRLRMLEPLRRLGGAPRTHPTRLLLPAPARAAARAALLRTAVPEQATLVALAPGARWPSKRWPVERFAALAARLAALPDLHVAVVGGEMERELCATVARAAGPRGALLAGELDLLGTAAVLERATLAVTNDSGLLHVAEAVGRPVVAVFGPTAPEFGYAPHRAASRLLRVAPPCSPCSKNGRRPCFQATHVCMEQVPLEMVEQAVLAVLRGAGGA